MSRDGGRCFLPGLWPPSSSSATTLASHPKMGANMQMSITIMSPQMPQLCSWSKWLQLLGNHGSRGWDIVSLAAPRPRGDALLGASLGVQDAHMPHRPALHPPLSGDGGEQSQSLLPQRRSPGTSSCLRPNTRDGRISTPPTSSTTLNFSVAQRVEQCGFFPL